MSLGEISERFLTIFDGALVTTTGPVNVADAWG
jgi:hypothetical protein